MPGNILTDDLARWPLLQTRRFRIFQPGGEFQIARAFRQFDVVPGLLELPPQPLNPLGALRRSSNSPRNLAPAIREPISRAKMVLSLAPSQRQ